jgi:branched-chain amino acid transport system ATP-binding protein
MSAVQPLLQAREVTVRFGGVTALASVSLDVMPGSRHGILGPNGSGKTTLFNALTGLAPVQQGRVQFDGRDITRLPAHRRLQAGLVRTFQITSLFPSMTARQNMTLAALARTGRHRRLLNRAWQEEQAAEIVDEVLDVCGLRGIAERPVRFLGYGEQRQLEIAVALTRGPRLLLLDEPTAGLSASETDAIAELIRQLPGTITIALIEHDLGVVFRLVDRLTVLHHGERIADGAAAEVREDERVRAVYLGR